MGYLKWFTVNILGVKRTLDRSDPDNWKVHLTMTAFIDDLVSLFSHDLEQVVGRGKYKYSLKT